MPILAVGLDSFDKPTGGCTTHLAALIASKLLDNLIDYPWLVRLNPSVPWKTRGNGAVALFLQVDGLSEAKTLVGLVEHTCKEYKYVGAKSAYIAVYSEEDTITGFQRANTTLVALYTAAVTRQVSLIEAHEAAKGLGEGRLLAWWPSRRGVLGAAAALGAAMWYDHTFELITYRRPEMIGRPRSIDAGSVIDFDVRYRPYTYLNYDYINERLLIAPHGPDPVLYGVRGEYPEPLLEALSIIESEEPSLAVMYRTNQATDEHLKRILLPGGIRVYECGVVDAYVERVEQLPGGHLHLALEQRGAMLHAAVYRETGLTRTLHHMLRPGLHLTAAGCVKQHRGRLTLNVEKICIDSADTASLKPRCPSCGGVLSSKGRMQGFTCRRCGSRWPDLTHIPLIRVAAGLCLTAAPSALHHLTQPCVRLGLTRRPRGLRPPSTPIIPYP